MRDSRVHPALEEYAGLSLPASSSPTPTPATLRASSSSGALSTLPLRTASQRSGTFSDGSQSGSQRHISQRRLVPPEEAGRSASQRSGEALTDSSVGASQRFVVAAATSLSSSQRNLARTPGSSATPGFPSTTFYSDLSKPTARAAPFTFELIGGGSSGGSSSGGGGGGSNYPGIAPPTVQRAVSTRSLEGHARRRAATARRRWREATLFVRAAVRFALLPSLARAVTAAAAVEARRARILSRKRGSGELPRAPSNEHAAGPGAGAGGGGGAAPPPPAQASPPSALTLYLASALCGGKGVPYALSPLSPSSAGSHFPSLIKPFLLLGDARDAGNAPLLLRLGVTHVLNTAAGTPPAHQEAFLYKHLPLDDTPEQPLLDFLPAAVAFMLDARDSGGLVLVHCQMGISRSVACVLAYLVLPTGGNLSLVNAWAYLRARRPVALPNAGFRAQLALWELAQRGSCSVLHLEALEAFWDTREWRGHADRLRQVAREEEQQRVMARMGWKEKLVLGLGQVWRGALRLLRG